ncbi:uncharacterized protein [Amphiura filiformis]|uniref:uncharacterized protein n=1 Tax=Amphiura filiformis TaxID=82378 RepID=UPI003B226EAB
MQPDKMPFAMIAYNIRYFNNTSPFGLTVPPPYAEWLHCMYNTFGQRFHELFEGPISDKMEIADRHPYRNVLLNVATVSKAYLKRQTDEKDKAEAENPPEELNEAPQEAIRRKQLMNKQGKAIRELMTDAAIPPLARRKLQQAFAIIQRSSNLTTPDNEPTCEHCGAAIPKPPKPPKKYMRKKRDRKRLGTDGRHKGEGKKRRIDKSGNKLMPVNLSSRQGKAYAIPVALQHSEDPQTSSMPLSSPRRKETSQRRTDSFPRNLYHSTPGTGPLERMIINAPGIPPARDLPPSLQEKWIPGHSNPIQEDWGVRPQQIPATAAAVAAAAAAARGVYSNHGSAAVNIMWEAGQPSSGWQHEEMRNQIEQHQQQQQQQHQHQQRTPMIPSTSSGSGIHIGQAHVSHTYYQ